MFAKKIINRFLPFIFIFHNLISCSFMSDYSSYDKKKDINDKFKITWNDGNGNEIYSDYVSYLEKPTYNNQVVPTKNSNSKYTYIFNNSWLPEIKAATADMTYTAQFDSQLNKYRVNWFNGDHLLKYDELYYGETPSFDGEVDQVINQTDDYEYRFVGWNPEISPVTKDINYYTNYQQYYYDTYYKVTFELNNGSDQIVYSYKEGDTISYPSNPSKPGYEFVSWDHSFTTMPNYDLTIKAQYSLSAPGLYIYNSLSTYQNHNDYNSFVSYSSLVNNNYLTTNGNNITGYSSSYFNSNNNRVLILILPSSVNQVSNLNGISRLIELHINSETEITLSSGCFNSCPLLEKVFFSGSGVVIFPGYSSIANISNGNFNKSFNIFNECTTLSRIYFNNHQKILSTGSLSNNYSTITYISLPSSLTSLYHYEFYNTRSSSNTSATNNYEFVSLNGIATLQIPESVTTFHYINSSNPLTLMTKYVFLGSSSTWNNIKFTYYSYQSDTAISKNQKLPNGFNISYSK